jgi:hypothetical protein
MSTPQRMASAQAYIVRSYRCQAASHQSSPTKNVRIFVN